MKVAIILLSCIAASMALEYQSLFQDVSEEVNNNPNAMWKAGYYKHWEGKNLDFFKSLVGTRLDKPVDPTKVKKVAVTRALPTSFESSSKWTNCPSITHIRDQANCGSCWAVSAAEVASDRTCIGTGKNVMLSAEDVMSCCSWCGQGCEGGYPIDAQAYFSYSGYVTGGDYGTRQGCQPYEIRPCGSSCNGDASTPSCSYSCESSYSTSYEADKHYGSDYYYVSASESAIQQEIYENGPIQCAFTVYADFYNYQTGVYHHVTGSRLGGHAIRVVGWGVENGMKYWKVANSWSTTWGESGYFKIQRGNNECGIEAQCVASKV